MKIILTLILLLCGIVCSHAAAPECTSHKFAEMRYAVSSGDPLLLDLPKGFTRPTHGVVVFLGGILNYPHWWIVDIDRHTLTNAMTIRQQDIVDIGTRGYKVRQLANGSELAFNTIILTPDQLSTLICRANELWSYKSPEEIQFEAWERAEAESKVLYKKWVHATNRCPKRRDCAWPPPPPLPPPVHPPVALTIDTVETITLLDAKSYRAFGDLGSLQGNAAEFAQWLMSFSGKF